MRQELIIASQEICVTGFFLPGDSLTLTEGQTANNHETRYHKVNKMPCNTREREGLSPCLIVTCLNRTTVWSVWRSEAWLDTLKHGDETTLKHSEAKWSMVRYSEAH